MLAPHQLFSTSSRSEAPQRLRSLFVPEQNVKSISPVPLGKVQAAARELHPVVHSGRMRAGNPYAHLILVLAGLTPLFIHFRGRPWDTTRVLGIAILVPSLAFWFLARLQLGRSFSVRAQAKQLVTHGLYSKIRNPVYLFGSLGILGIILYIGHLQWLWVFALVVPLQLFRIRKEEKVLREKFGDAYLEYKSRTWF